MSVWYSLDEAVNQPEIPERLKKSVVLGRDEVYRFISNLAVEYINTSKRSCLLAFDGYLGVDWKSTVCKLRGYFHKQGLSIEEVDITSCYKSSREIEKMVRPYLDKDPHFGFVFKGRLNDFFDVTRVDRLKNKLKGYKRNKIGNTSTRVPDVVICFGPGAAISRLRQIYDMFFYLDITREELLNRAEAKTVLPLGKKGKRLPMHLMIRRFYYVDYPVLNRHKRYISKFIDWYIDANFTLKLKLIGRESYKEILSIIAGYPFRLKPVYIPGPWGGNWLKRLRRLPKEMVNCAWSFEVIPAEQSFRVKMGSAILEIPFYNLFWEESEKIMGNFSVRKFGLNFPVTINYDDSYEGGDMAIQVHPDNTYIKNNFNEPIRQDESYYIVDIGPGARTYAGLKEDTDIKELYQAVVKAKKENVPFDHNRYINSIPSRIGDRFLWPAGTIHGSGRNQVVLEISAHFSANSGGYTFHLYDYLRPDLEGKLRAIHPQHAFSVIRFNRRSRWVAKHLLQEPKLLRKGDGWAEYLVGERRDMYYKVHSLEFKKKMENDTKGKFHLLTLVAGDKVLVQSKKYPGRQYKFKLSETIIVPACLGKYSIINLGNKPCKVTNGLLK